MVLSSAYISEGQPMAPIEKGFFPMGIFKIGPNEYRIKARVKIPDRDPTKPEDDRRKQARFYGTRAQAERKYIEMREELRTGVKRSPLAGIFADLLEQYRESRGGAIPRSERSVYETLHADLGGTLIEELEGALIRYQHRLQRATSPATGKVLSHGSINRRRAMVATTLSLAVDLKLIKTNPMTRVVWPKLKEVPRDRRLTPEEIQRLMDTVSREAPHLVEIFWFALRVPCRKSELVNMGRRDLDLFANAIRVHNGTTKNDVGSWKPIPEEMLPYFRSLPPESPFLFFRKVGAVYRCLGDFKTAWNRCLFLAGIEDFRFHDTRHIAATNMVNAGMSERDVMKVAGWKTNMLSTYWNSSSMETLSRVRFLPGSTLVAGGNKGATSTEAVEKSGEIKAERAVS